MNANACLFPALFAAAAAAFAVVAAVEDGGDRDRLAGWAGLGRRAPLLSACLFVFMLSLAGIPLLAGFFGKVYLFTAAAAGAPHLGLLWLVIVAVGATAIALYYYLQVLKQIYAAAPPAGSTPVRPPRAALVSLALPAGLVIAFGCAPGWLLGKLSIVPNSSVF